MSICLRYTNTKEAAEEVLNDSFLKVFKKIRKYNSSLSFRPWLRRIIINTAIDHYRKNRQYSELTETFETELNEYGNKALEDLETEDILKLLRKLPQKQRITFNLYEIEGYRHREIAEYLGVTEATSRSYLKRAKKNLRELYNKYFNPDHE